MLTISSFSFLNLPILLLASLLVQSLIIFILLNLAGFAILPNPKHEVHFSLFFKRAIEGMFIYSAFCWYFWDKHLDLSILALIFISIVLAIITIKLILVCNKKNLKYRFYCFIKSAVKSLFIYLILCLFASLLWLPYINSSTSTVLTQGNNDIFAWSLVANHLLGISDLDLIKGASHFVGLIKDCFGSYVIVGLSSIINGSLPLENITLTIIFLSSLIGCLLLSTITLYYKLDFTIAILLTLLFLVSPFWLQISSHGFISQMTATTGIYYGLLTISETIKTNKSIIIFFVFLISYFILFYPGLAIPHSLVILTFLIILNLILEIKYNNNDTIYIAKKILKILLNFFSALVISLMLFYDLFIHAYFRFLEASRQQAGWSEPLLDPTKVILLGYNPFASFISSPFGYVCLLLIIIVLGMLASKQDKLYIFEDCSIRSGQWSGYYLYILLLVAYLFVYQVLGPSYQQWKFASYYLLTFSIFIWGLFAIQFIHISHLGTGLKPLQAALLE